MKIIEPYTSEIYNSNPQKHIEEIARTCYKSNDLITEDSNKKFISNLYERKHFAMLEHFIFVYRVTNSVYNHLVNSSNYIATTYTDDDGCVISFSARALLNSKSSCKKELIERVIYDYNCHELFGGEYIGKYSWDFQPISNEQLKTCSLHTRNTHGWKSIKFVCDRGISHEIVRHRDASFAQESTRYANYSKDKFGSEITCIEPFFFEKGSVAYQQWFNACYKSEKTYIELIEAGHSPQEARSVLPNSLKTEVIMTARNYEWVHFLELRCDNAAHPQMIELTKPLEMKFADYDYEIFGNLTYGPKN